MKFTPVKRFWGLLNQYRSEIRQIYIFALFIGIVNLTLPLGIQAIINFLQTGELTTTWIILVCFVLLGIAITGVLQVLQLRIVENIQQDLFARSAIEFGYRFPKIKFLELDKIHAPELANRFFDTLTIQKGLPKVLIDFSLAIFQIFFGLILLTIYSPYFIILGFSLAFILWVIFRITGPKGLRTSLKESKIKYQLAHWLEEIARVTRSFKLYASGKLHIDKTDRIIGRYLISREGHFRVLLNQFKLFVGFKVILAASLLLLGGYLVFAERMNIGQFVAAEIIIILIINSVEKVLRTVDTIYDVLTALDKIGYVTDLPLDQYTGKARVPGHEAFHIKLENLNFSFPGAHSPVLKDISLEIKAREKVILAGKSGSGKSTLLQILSGIYHQNSGQYLIDEVPHVNLDRDYLNQKIGVFFSSNNLFEGSIKDNILMGRDADEKDIQEVLHLLQLDTYINKEPMGIDTEIDSGGRRIPRSIIQKIQLARTILQKPRLLLLEDPLNFIDDDEKKRIIDFIMSPKAPWTVIVVSDFYYWKNKANRVIDLSNE